MTRRDAVENILCLLRADPPFSTWSKAFETLEAAWDGCAEPAWMLWLLQTLEYDGARTYRPFALACAARVASSSGGGACQRALEIAENVASGAAPKTELAPAYRAARAHAETLARRADFSEAMAAAAAAAAATVRERPFDAAVDASSEARRAVAWDVAAERSASDEAAWQAAELRRLVGEKIAPLLERARLRTRGKLALI